MISRGDGSYYVGKIAQQSAIRSCQDTLGCTGMYHHRGDDKVEEILVEFARSIESYKP